MPTQSGTVPRLFKVLAAAVLHVSTAMPSHAQEYPTHPVSLEVPFAPRGGTDSIARDIAREFTDRLGKPVVVDNRGGDGGASAAAAIAKAPPDGHTLLFVTSTFITHAAADPAAKHEVQRDFAPVAMIGRGPLMVDTTKSLAAKSVRDLVARSLQDSNFKDLPRCICPSSP